MSANSLDDNLKILSDIIEFAYSQGMHELGYNILEETMEQLIEFGYNQARGLDAAKDR